MLKLSTISHKALNFPSNTPSIFSLKVHNFNRVLSMPSSAKVVAEYAKSSRSSCKKCSKTINKDALRLGLVTRDARGFDMTKWHHFSCFSFGSDSVSSVDSINGFTSLKSDDQEALKEVVDKASKSGEEGADVALEETEVESRVVEKRKGRKTNEENEEERVSKTMKLSANDGKLEIAFSLTDIKDTYKEATLLPKWKAFQTVIYLEKDDGLHDSTKIAAFDFDGCLAKTSVKRVGAAAWSLMYATIPDKLKSLYDDGYKLVIFTNESNIERWKNKRQIAVDSKIGRLNAFIEKVKVPVQVFIACGYDKSSGQAEDPYRKPKTGMWQLMEKHFNSGLEVNLKQSFYVGDAAGRPDDHSDADIRFAEGIGLKFYVPEDFFGK